MRHRVDCVTSNYQLNAWERIIRLGGVIEGANASWGLSNEECIAQIERGADFFAIIGGHKVKLSVVTDPDGHKYLQTTDECEDQSNLLAMPKCP
jgi:hypothetical protein